MRIGLILTNDVLRHKILGNGLLLQAVPAFAAQRAKLQELDKGCLNCQGKDEAIKARNNFFNDLRILVARATPETKQKIREVLKVPADKVIMVSYNETGARGQRVVPEYF